MQKIVSVYERDSIECRCKSIVADLTATAEMEAGTTSTVTMTSLDRFSQEELAFDVVIRDKADGYMVHFGPAGETPIIRYFFTKDEIDRLRNQVNDTRSS